MRPHLLLFLLCGSTAFSEPLYHAHLSLDIPHLTSDLGVAYDYDIVYVRTPRKGDTDKSLWAEISHPHLMDPQGDLMLLRPDGSEEVLVKGGEDGSVTDPFVSIDGEWVFYSHIKGLKGTGQHGNFPRGGADIYKLKLKTRKVVQLTEQRYTPNTGAADWASDFRSHEKNKTRIEYGVFNLGPCPLPDGRLVFVSNRDGFKPPKHPAPMLQLFVMDDDGRNVEKIGHLNLGMALHPVALKDGRIMFSTMESMGLRSNILWGLWSIKPDGTGWGPMISAFDTGGAPNSFHFQTQLSDGSIIAEEYYNQNNSGFGAYFKLPPNSTRFGPADRSDPRNGPYRFGRHYNAKGKYYRLPFSPEGLESFTRFANNGEGPSDPTVPGKKDGSWVGKFTHPSGAPGNHLLTVWSPGPGNHQNGLKPPDVDGGLYLIKNGQPIDRPDQMRLIKNDPKYNEQWPRAVVSYQRIYGQSQPDVLDECPNDGGTSAALPKGTPFGLVGTSSMYKRESYPDGTVKPGSVTATFTGERERNGYQNLDPFNTSQNGASLNWFNQGADAGRYANADIHAVRILAMEPATDRHRGQYPKDGRRFFSHAQERLRILGEIPVRKQVDGTQPIDPDGHPDTSFVVKIPGDVGYTFQTLDKEGRVLNMAQTWHQVRPGEVRTDCGGCHAHSQEPTDFSLTYAAKPAYNMHDLANTTPMLAGDELRIEKTGVVNVEYRRDIQPLFERSCVPCHSKTMDNPAGKLVLDADDSLEQVGHEGKFPGTYYRLALDAKATYGHKPVIHNAAWRQSNASRYIRKFQSRRSLLVWKIYGERLDGWHNDDFPSARVPGDANTLQLAEKPIENTQRNRDQSDLDYRGKAMPPPEAMAGRYEGPNGQRIKVPPLTDEEKRLIVRWIDLGCPIDRDEDGQYGWNWDDNRPTLTVTAPRRGAQSTLNEIIVGMHDYGTGLDHKSFSVTTSIAIDGHPAGNNLARLFSEKEFVWSYHLKKPLRNIDEATITVSVKDHQGNMTQIERVFSVRPETVRK